MTNDIDIIRTPDIVAAEINQIKDQTRKLVLNNAIEIGKRLCEAKAMIDHGKWTGWLKQNVDYSQGTAENLMKIYTEYGAAQGQLWGASAKSQTFEILSYSKALALLAIPSEERENFIKDNQVEDMSARELKKAIEEKENAERKIKEYGMKCDYLNNQVQEMEKRAEKSKEKIKEQKQAAKEAEEVIKKLQEQLDGLKSDAGGDEAADLKLQIQAFAQEKETREARIKELEAELAKPVTVEAGAAVENIPEEVKNELETLRAQAKELAAKSDPASIKFRTHFDLIVNDFNKALEDIAEMKGPKTQYVDAIRALALNIADRAKQYYREG